jgi:hypothetical protein
MSTKLNLEALFEGMDKTILNEENQKKLETLINETVDARVSAKEKLLTEEVETLKKKIQDEAAANEKVLVEQAEKYKKSLEETVLEETVKFKESYTAKKDAEVTELKEKLQGLVLEEAKAFKAKQDAVLVEEVKKFRTELTEKVSDYIEAKVSELVPSEIMESAAKLAVLEPLVGGIMESFSKNFVKLDTTSYKLIKEAKDEIASLQAQVQEKAKLEIKLKKEKQDVERALRVSKLTEGLTQVQKVNAEKLLEGVEYENLDTRFKQIRDIVINESATPAPKAEEKKVEKLVESKVAPKVEAAAKPEVKTKEADKAILQHQLKKVLNESEAKAEATGAKPAPKVKTEGATAEIQKWANKVKPGYIETQSK